MESRAFSPAHITGFVSAYLYMNDPLMSGSKGVGFSIIEGVTTNVQLTEVENNEVVIKINGIPRKDAVVSEYVVNRFIVKTRMRCHVLVEHLTDLPIGVGFGTSGAAALSLALAMNDVLGLGLSNTEAAKEAHIAEVVCKTGLGTVLAELHGGFEARLEPGAPGLGKIVQIPFKDDYQVVVLTFGPLSTESMLDWMKMNKSVFSFGEELLNIFIQNQSVENFLLLSNRFTNKLGISSRVQDVLNDAGKAGFTCGVAMFGETVFSLVKPEEVDKLKRVFMKFKDNSLRILTTRIDKKGARLL